MVQTNELLKCAEELIPSSDTKDYVLCCSSEGKTMATNRFSGCRRLEVGGELTSHRPPGISGMMESVLKLDCGDGFTTV